MTARSFATEALGSAAGVRRGWRTARLSEAEARQFLAAVPWLDARPAQQIVAHRAWRDRRGLRRVDVAFGDGARLSVRRLTRRLIVQMSRWR